MKRERNFILITLIIAILGMFADAKETDLNAQVIFLPRPVSIDK